jgi:hypothetical protein
MEEDLRMGTYPFLRIMVRETLPEGGKEVR